MSRREVSILIGGTRRTFTLPDPHSSAPGTVLTVANVGQWECIHEGDHAFWESTAIGHVYPPGCD